MSSIARADWDKILKESSIPVELNPESKRITCGRWCGGCRGTDPGCKNPPGEQERQKYVGGLREFGWVSDPVKVRNLGILTTLKLCGISSQKHWSVFLPTGYRLSEIKNLELRRIVQLRQSFTEVPDQLRLYARQVEPINLSRQQWKVLLPTLQDHFPSVPRKFYMLLIKLSLGLGFLTKRLCGHCRHLCPFIFRRVFTSRLVRSKYARALNLWSWEKPVNQPYWLDKFFPNPNPW